MACSDCTPLGPSCGPAFANLIWVNALATNAGTGSVSCPFPTPAAAVASMDPGSSATIIIAGGDYTATPAFSIAGKDVAFNCPGGAANGARTPPLRARMPAITFDATAPASDPLTFFADGCDFGTLTVNTAVNANLENCSSTWADAGGLATVRAQGNPETFGAPGGQQSIGGSFGSVELEGMRFTSIACARFVSSRGRLLAGGTGVVASVGAVFYEHEFAVGGVVVTAPDIFVDQWSWYQVEESLAVLTGQLSVQELSPLTFSFGCLNWAATQYLNPWIKFGNGAASPAPADWMNAPRNMRAFDLQAQLDAALGVDATFELYQGATPGGVVATGFIVSIPTGQLDARVTLAPAGSPIVIPEGNFFAMRCTAGAGVNRCITTQVTAF
jgi:hypothetical protein